MGERHAEFRVSHQHTARRLATHFHGSSREAVELGIQFQFHHMQTFLQSFHEQLALTGLARLQSINIIRGARLAIRSRCTDGNAVADGTTHAHKAQRIISRRIK